MDYRGSHTGVYVAQLLLSASEMGDTDRYENNSYSSLGKCISLRANRVSFIFDLRGPSLTVDTGEEDQIATVCMIVLIQLTVISMLVFCYSDASCYVRD